jgi:nucleotide-binding universal stress UspA family protein
VISGAAQRSCRNGEAKSERAENHGERKEVANGSSAAAPAVGVGGILLFEGEGEPKESEGVAVSIFPTKILLASDGSEEAELALMTAIDLTDNTNSELHVVTVGGAEYRHGYDIPESGDFLKEAYKAIEREAQETLDEQVRKIEEARGTVTEAHLRMGRAAEEIVNLGEEIGAGLIIIGSRGRGGIRRALMGSVSDAVIRHAHCPVLVVRSEERWAKERRAARGA